MKRIENIGNFGYGFIKFQDVNTKLWGYMDNIGREIIEPRFSSCKDFENDGLAIVDVGNHHYVLISTDGKIVSKEKYSFIGELENGVRIVTKEITNPFTQVTTVLYGLIGSINIPCKYRDIKIFDNGLGFVSDKKNRYYVIGKTPSMLNPKTVSQSYVNSYPLYITRNGIISCIDGKCYYYSDEYNRRGDDIKLIFNNLSADYGMSGLYPIFDEPFTYDEKLGKYTAIVNIKRQYENGYDPCVIDESGTILIQPNFPGDWENYCYRLSRNSHGFYDGIFMHDEKREYGVVNSNGKVIIRTKYNNRAVILDKLIIIDDDYYDYEGNKIKINGKYKNIEYKDNIDILIATLENGKKVYLDTSFNELFNSYEFDYCEFPHDNIYFAGNYVLDIESNDNYKFLQYKVFKREKENGYYVKDLYQEEELFTYPDNDSQYEVSELKHYKYENKDVFYGYLKNKKGSVIINNGKAKILPYLLLIPNEGYFTTCTIIPYYGLITLDGIEVLPQKCESIRYIGNNLFLVTSMYNDEEILLNTNMHDYITGNNNLNYFEYFYSEDTSENIIKELNSHRDFVLRNFHFRDTDSQSEFDNLTEYYGLQLKKHLKIPITKNELCYKVYHFNVSIPEIVSSVLSVSASDREIEEEFSAVGHYEIKDEYKSLLKYFNLENIDFYNIDISGIDFSNTNARININEVYKNNVDGCVFSEDNLIGDSEFHSGDLRYKVLRR